jgi:hypothetical protein
MRSGSDAPGIVKDRFGPRNGQQGELSTVSRAIGGVLQGQGV